MKALYRHKKSGDIFAIETDAKEKAISDLRFNISEFGLKEKTQPPAGGQTHLGY